MTNLKMVQDDATKIFVEVAAKNPMFHGKTKHFKIKCYFVREIQNNDEVNLVHCNTEAPLANILTKGPSKSKFELLRKKLVFVAKIARSNDKCYICCTIWVKINQ